MGNEFKSKYTGTEIDNISNNRQESAPNNIG